MLQTMLSPEAMTKAAKWFMRHFPYDKHEEMIKRAWQLYRTGHVYNVTVSDHILQGKVSDKKTTHEPHVHMKQPAKSYCTCTVGNICVHHIALFLYAYNQVQSVGDFMKQWKNPRKKEDKPSVRALNTNEAPKQLLHRWWTSFEDECNRLVSSRILTTDERMRELVYIFFPTFKKPTGKSAFLDHLYYTHAALFTFIKLASEKPESDRPVYTSIMLERMVENFAATVDEAIATLAKKAHGQAEMLYETIPYVRRLLCCDSAHIRTFIVLYENAWKHIFTEKTWREQERAWARAEINKREQNIKAVPFRLATSYLSFLLNDDEQAYALIESFPYLATEYMSTFMQLSFAEKQKERGVRWWERLKEKIDSYLSTIYDHHRDWFVDHVLFAYNQYRLFVREATDEEYEQLLQKLLPYSIHMYADYLFHKEKWKALADLYIALEAPLEAISPFYLREMEKADRTAVLPLYHQHIARCIEQKHRAAYAEAIKYLKKLRTHYRALKQTTRFETYVAKLAEQTKRLRSFQDMLRKGKFV